MKLRLQKSTNWAVQNKNYNGWTTNTYINSVYVFAPDGKICCCTLNCPGSFHDSTQADYGIYTKLHKIYSLHKGKVVVDSAFKFRNTAYLIKSSQDKPTQFDRETEGRRQVLNKDATSVRQMSEWGMRMLQGQFPRMYDNIQLEHFGERKVILHLHVLLYNFQASKMGMNQIFNTYMNKKKGFYSYTITKNANTQFN